jgi:hypothetical protein
MRQSAKADAGKYSLKEICTNTVITGAIRSISGPIAPKSAPRFRRAARLPAVLATALVWLFAPLTQNVHAGSPQTPWQNLTPSQLTAVWRQWLYSVQVSVSPAFDTTGANAFQGQLYTTLLFLAGTFSPFESNGNVIGQVTRTITVKQGTALFFPLINTEFDNIGCTPHLAGPGACLTPRPAGVPALQAEAY